ncbi:hypothetical protein EMGBS6_13220 [Opitutia bacterium]|nr:hypothetical protein EMGBS6_13220 [Opitutae bacterium]
MPNLTEARALYDLPLNTLIFRLSKSTRPIRIRLECSSAR